MYDLRGYRPPEKIYGNVKAGWNHAKIYQGGLKNGRNKRGKQYQYFLIDCEILEEGVLVPFFSFFDKEKEEPDPLFGKLLVITGLVGRNFKGDQAGFFKAMIGVELMVKVAHTYKKSGKNRIRKDRVVDFRPLEDAIVYEDFEPDNEPEESDVQGDVGRDFQNGFKNSNCESDDKIPF